MRKADSSRRQLFCPTFDGRLDTSPISCSFLSLLYRTDPIFCPIVTLYNHTFSNLQGMCHQNIEIALLFKIISRYNLCLANLAGPILPLPSFYDSSVLPVGRRALSVPLANEFERLEVVLLFRVLLGVVVGGSPGLPLSPGIMRRGFR
jgi:hypothetical protein